MLDRVELWIDQRERGPADHKLLLVGCPFGPFVSASYDDGAIAAVLRDQRDRSRKRSPRRFDPEGWAVTILAAAVRPQFLMSRTDLAPRAERHDVTFGPTLPWRRVLANAQPGEAVSTGTDHRDLRRQSLFVTPAKPDARRNWAHKGRAMAITLLVGSLERAPLDQLSISSADYVDLLAKGLRLLDELPLGSTGRTTTEEAH